MENYFKIFIIITILNLSAQATINKVEDLFGDLYSGDIYSGYLNTKIEGNELFYIYAPSQNDPDKAPIMLWLNGGPGCSSLFGLLGEVGPVVTDNFSGEFKTNPYSWNINANLLVIEQPAGVGFSKTSDPKYLWTDDVTAENLLVAVKDFLNAFNLKGRPFHISGESYAGVYIPFLATHMLEDTSEDKVNLSGVLVGNGLTDFDTDVERSMVEFGFYHGLISIELYNSFKRNCLHLPDELTPEENDSQEKNDGFFPRNVTHKCNEIRTKIRNNMSGSDIYGIYRICPPRSRFSVSENSPFYLNSQFTMKKTITKKLIQYKYQNNGILNLEPENDVFPGGCGEDLTFDRFLNDPEVKQKLAVYDQSLNWTQCSDVNYEMNDSYRFYAETMHKYPTVKVWVFSGTEDGVLPTLGTMRWINKLGFNIETKWKQWKVGDQVAGYVQKYQEGLVIVTVKGAGHMVPQDQHASAYNMVTAFFNGVLP
jgi:carboxypeptidase C (cathepsin A)